MNRFVVAIAILFVGCKGISPKAQAGDAAPAAAAPDGPPAAALGPDAAPPPAQRPGGPTASACAHAADHLGQLVEGSMTGNASPEDRAYVARLMAENRSSVVWFCVETAAPDEVDCMLAASDFATLASCERFRRQLGDLLSHESPTLEDCERFFDRLRTFKIMDGAVPESVDRDRDQIVRACQDKAKVNTLACFIAARTYEQARQCR